MPAAVWAGEVCPALGQPLGAGAWAWAVELAVGPAAGVVLSSVRQVSESGSVREWGWAWQGEA